MIMARCFYCIAFYVYVVHVYSINTLCLIIFIIKSVIFHTANNYI